MHTATDLKCPTRQWKSARNSGVMSQTTIRVVVMATCSFVHVPSGVPTNNRSGGYKTNDGITNPQMNASSDTASLKKMSTHTCQYKYIALEGCVMLRVLSFVARKSLN
jgi:hypothetical protein